MKTTKPYTHESFGQSHRKPDFYTARENESATTREAFQNQLRNIDTTTSRRHNEASSEAVMRVVMDSIAMREALEAVRKTTKAIAKQRNRRGKALRDVARLLDGLDAVQWLSDEHWAKKQKENAAASVRTT